MFNLSFLLPVYRTEGFTLHHCFVYEGLTYFSHTSHQELSRT